jgi:hypothetical protein
LQIGARRTALAGSRATSKGRRFARLARIDFYPFRAMRNTSIIRRRCDAPKRPPAVRRVPRLALAEPSFRRSRAPRPAPGGGPVDYVMKPFSTARIATTVTRLKQRLKNAPAKLDGLLETLAQAATPKGFLRWVTASNGAELQLITVDEICYFRQNGSEAKAVTANFEAHVPKSIAELSASLDPALFVPVGSTTPVNVNARARLTAAISTIKATAR